RWQLRPRWHGWQPELALLLHTFLAGFAFQVHPAGIGLTLGSLWLGFRFRLWHRWLPIVGGIALGTLAAAPALWTIAADGAGAQAELQELLSAPAQTTAVGFQQLGQLATANGWEAFWLSQSWVWPSPLAQLLPLLTLLLALLASGGLLLLSFRLGRDLLRHNRATPTAVTILTALVPVWSAAAPLFFLRSSTPVYIQYQLASAPALFLAMGALVAWLVAQWEWLRWPTAVTLLLIAALHTAAITLTLNTVSHTLVEGGMGTPLRYPQNLTNILKSTGQPIAVHAIGDAVEYDGDAAVFRVLLWNYPHQIADGRHVLLLPGAGGTLLFPAENVPSWSQLQALALPGTTAVYPRRAGDLPFLTQAIPALNEADLLAGRFTAVSPPISLENGATLHGWRTDTQENGRVQLTTLWRIDQLPPAGQFQQFNHLYLPDSATPDQVRDATTSSAAWQAGDWLITWAVFDAPAQPVAHFDVGMYTWPDLQRSPVHGREPDQDPLAPIRLIP
ncbi:MAG: hypothetical protein KDD89_01060, partial [Anaerolineales bacterium]|nr:hypothetical protein [Anaerolineales bacterium]